ncbi:MAG: glycosyltransferase family 39 protein [Krumholzibacteria bacterium]|nr:glycosyltransferase family 39 protein [Candidatus Krumholzibacteria bacterium]
MASFLSTPRRLPGGTPAWAAFVFAVSLLNRLVFARVVGGYSLLGAAGLDSAYYHGLAAAWAQGTAHPGVFFMGPLYPAFLSLVYRVVGAAPGVAVALNVVVGCTTAVVVFLIGRRLFDRRTGLLAAALVNLYGYALFLENHVLMAPLLALLLALLVLVLLRAVGGGRAWLFAAAGLLAGLLAAGRGTYLLALVLAVAVVLLRRPGARTRGGLARLALLAGGVLVAVLPVTIHNWRAGGGFVPLTTNGGINYAIGNRDNANGTFIQIEGVEFFQPGSPEDGGSVRRAGQLAGRDLTPAQASRFWLRQGLDWNIANPGRTLALWGRKLLLVVIDYEIPQIENYAWARAASAGLKAWWVGFGLLAALGVGGMLSAWRTVPASRPAALAVAAVVASLLPFFITARYRVPVAPLLAVFAAHFVFRLADLVRDRGAPRRLAPVAATVVLLAVAYLYVPAAVEAGADRLGDYTAGVVAIRENRLADAVRAFEASVRKHPDHVPSHANLGTLYAQLGEYERGRREFETVLALEPDNRRILAGYLTCLEQLGLADEARAVREKLGAPR